MLHNFVHKNNKLVIIMINSSELTLFDSYYNQVRIVGNLVIHLEVLGDEYGTSDTAAESHKFLYSTDVRNWRRNFISHNPTTYFCSTNIFS